MSDQTKCSLSFICTKKWEELSKTEDAEIRYCDSCAKGVFAVKHLDEFELASALGRCVALTQDNQVFGWVGEPEDGWSWMESDSIRIRLRVKNPHATNWPKLALAFPHAFAQLANQATAAWITLGEFNAHLAEKLHQHILSAFPELDIVLEEITPLA